MEHFVPEECRMQLAAVEYRKNRLEPGNGDSKGAVSEGGRYSAADGFLMLV